MQWDDHSVGSQPVSEITEHPLATQPKSWSVTDFLLVWLGGFVGAGLFFLLARLLDNDDWVIVLGLAGQYVGNLGVLWLLSRFKDDTSLGFEIEPRDAMYIVLGLLLQLAVALLLLPLAQLLFPDGQSPQEVAEIIGSANSSMLLKLSLVVAAVVLAPVTEEIIFRGVLLKALRNHSNRFIMVATALVFSAVHLLGLDLDRLWTSAALVLPQIFLLGLLLAWLTLRTGRLGPAIFLHSGWNLLAALVLLIPSDLLEQAG